MAFSIGDLELTVSVDTTPAEVGLLEFEAELKAEAEDPTTLTLKWADDTWAKLAADLKEGMASLQELADDAVKLTAAWNDDSWVALDESGTIHIDELADTLPSVKIKAAWDADSWAAVLTDAESSTRALQDLLGGGTPRNAEEQWMSQVARLEGFRAAAFVTPGGVQGQRPIAPITTTAQDLTVQLRPDDASFVALNAYVLGWMDDKQAEIDHGLIVQLRPDDASFVTLNSHVLGWMADKQAEIDADQLHVKLEARDLDATNASILEWVVKKQLELDVRGLKIKLNADGSSAAGNVIRRELVRVERDATGHGRNSGKGWLSGFISAFGIGRGGIGQTGAALLVGGGAAALPTIPTAVAGLGGLLSGGATGLGGLASFGAFFSDWASDITGAYSSITAAQKSYANATTFAQQREALIQIWQAMRQLDPAQQTVLKNFQGLHGLWDSFIFNKKSGFEQVFEQISTEALAFGRILIESVAPAVVPVGKALEGLGGSFIQALKSGPIHEFFQTIIKDSPALITSFGNGAIALAKFGATFINAFSGTSLQVFSGLAHDVETWASMFQKFAASKAFQSWLAETARLATPIGNAFKSIGSALLGLVGALLTSLNAGAVGWVKAFTDLGTAVTILVNALVKSGALTDFFSLIGTLLGDLGPLLPSIATALSGLAPPLAALIQGVSAAVGPNLATTVQALDQLAGPMASLFEALTPLIVAVTPSVVLLVNALTKDVTVPALTAIAKGMTDLAGGLKSISPFIGPVFKDLDNFLKEHKGVVKLAFEIAGIAGLLAWSRSLGNIIGLMGKASLIEKLGGGVFGALKAFGLSLAALSVGYGIGTYLDKLFKIHETLSKIVEDILGIKKAAGATDALTKALAPMNTALASGSAKLLGEEITRIAEVLGKLSGTQRVGALKDIAVLLTKEWEVQHPKLTAEIEAKIGKKGLEEDLARVFSEITLRYGASPGFKHEVNAAANILRSAFDFIGAPMSGPGDKGSQIKNIGADIGSFSRPEIKEKFAQLQRFVLEQVDAIAKAFGKHPLHYPVRFDIGPKITTSEFDSALGINQGISPANYQKFFVEGKNVSAGFLEGLLNKQPDVTATSKNVMVDTPLKTIIEGLLTHSPSQVYHQQGAWVATGFAQGILSQVTQVESAMRTLVRDAYRSFNTAVRAEHATLGLGINMSGIGIGPGSNRPGTETAEATVHFNQGSIQVIVQGNVAHETLPQLERALDQAVHQAAAALRRGRTTVARR